MSDFALLQHDIKNALHVMRVTLEAMNDGLVPCDGKHIRLVVDELQQVVDFLETAKPTKTNSQDKQGPLDATALVKRLAEEAAVLFQKKRIPLLLKLPSKPCYVDVSREDFTRALLNLFSNEEKYLFPGAQVMLELYKADSIKQTGDACQGKKNDVILKITDTGPGIDPIEIARILKKGERGRQTATHCKDAALGKGYGLYQVATFMQEAQGALEISNTEKGGLSIMLSFPEALFLA